MGHPGNARSFGGGNGTLVFPNERGKSLHDKRLSRLLQKLQIAAVPHGFRSSFRDWAAEKTDHSRDVTETALAHVVHNKVEAAYARYDRFERRRVLVEDWARYLARETVTAPSTGLIPEVVPSGQSSEATTGF